MSPRGEAGEGNVPRWVFMLLWSMLGALVLGLSTLVVGAFLDVRDTQRAIIQRQDAMDRKITEVKTDVKWLKAKQLLRLEDDEEED